MVEKGFMKPVSEIELRSGKGIIMIFVANICEDSVAILF